MSVQTIEKEFLGAKLTMETGRLAKLASGSVTVRYGDTMILVTSTVGGAREGMDFFPLLVDYQEKFYATGKMKGSRFIKREGRPSESSILAARMIDRPMRPLFPKRMRNDVQVVVTVLSADMEHDPEDISILGASMATMLTGAPFAGPIAGVRVGLVMMEDGSEQLVVNPSYDQLKGARLDIMIAGSKDSLTMIEAAANEVDTDTLMKALEMGHKHIGHLCDMQEEFLKQVGEIAPLEIVEDNPAEEVVAFAAERITADKIGALFGLSYGEYKKAISTIKEEFFALAKPYMERAENPWKKAHVGDSLNDTIKKHVRAKMIGEKTRLDGRGLTDIRPISCEAGLIPRPHGSGLFNRGQTQVLSLVTLGSPGDAQIIDEMDDEEEKRYMHHYNFPGFSVGEVSPMRGPGRREIGHGDLAERAVFPMIPSKEEFPYTIRVVSEVLGSNGSTSMGSVCGSTLSLMDAGVPLTRPVSGIAMGLIMDKQGNYIVLSDIQGQEDFLGDMDFKVAGTEKGITALQLDTKLQGLSMEVLRQAIEQGNDGRAFILGKMLEVLPAPRSELAAHAPRIISFSIPEKSIGEVIGPGGKTIRGIIEETGVKIDIDDSGLVMITADDLEAAEMAKARIDGLTYVPKPGDVMMGEVKRLATFGAFVEYAPGKDGLLHISEIAPFRVNNVEDILKEGQKIKVKVKSVEEDGKKVALTHKEFFEEEGVRGN